MSDVAGRLRELADAARRDEFDIDHARTRIAALAPDVFDGYADALDALAAVRDWVREGKGTESDAAEALDSVLAEAGRLLGDNT
jgi:hypothetical protein